jgi:hypothetical protein
MFHKATKTQSRMRLGLCGPAGSGKTYTALLVASALGSKIAVLDSEHGSASKYADEFSFDTITPTEFGPQVYIDTIRAAERGGYDVLILDSLSHAWSGTGGVLEQVDAIKDRSKSGNAFSTGWREMTPLHNKMVDAIVGAGVHIIATMRTKTEYVVEKNERGQSVPRKVGMAPVQRDGMEYEFDIVGDLDWEHKLVITKTRCRALDGKVLHKPGREFAEALAGWLGDGAAQAPAQPATPAPQAPPATKAPAKPAATKPDTTQLDNAIRNGVAAQCKGWRVSDDQLAAIKQQFREAGAKSMAQAQKMAATSLYTLIHDDADPGKVVGVKATVQEATSVA